MMPMSSFKGWSVGADRTLIPLGDVHPATLTSIIVLWAAVVAVLSNVDEHVVHVLYHRVLLCASSAGKNLTSVSVRSVGAGPYLCLCLDGWTVARKSHFHVCLHVHLLCSSSSSPPLPPLHLLGVGLSPTRIACASSLSVRCWVKSHLDCLWPHLHLHLYSSSSASFIIIFSCNFILIFMFIFFLLLLLLCLLFII